MRSKEKARFMECDFRRLCEAALTIRRSTSSSSVRRSPARGGAASFGGLRFRLGLILVAIAALALMAGGPPPLNGVDTLDLTDDGAVIATITGGVSPYLDAKIYESYISRDGGMSWSMHDGPMFALYEFQSVDTPRGKYVIDELGVARLGADGRRELVYSTEYL